MSYLFLERSFGYESTWTIPKSYEPNAEGEFIDMEISNLNAIQDTYEFRDGEIYEVPDHLAEMLRSVDKQIEIAKKQRLEIEALITEQVFTAK